MRYHLTPVKMANIKDQQTTSANKDVEKGEPFCSTGRNTDWCIHCGKHYGAAFDSAIPLMRINPEEPKTLIRKNISTSMFIAS